ncbi:tRNA (adenosine(37)-N6)-threonylcarbamoyltransferase complex dimerization subunit type 1 TsaB [Nocardioides sp. zg-536]|uniref:tRNA (Adenosine(37)-N6)-threonylcarbamoyltransferase complex dimerization subunit type 1 TsaB n=1 Tax=Nocardioides faecalis TaxID=2803858 RepID=A0A939BSL2_9ACTN|nr:tRNA (adenosine(37)-N6)-threonylcarbamoyltransferase complex dimerization subunit type 1 TsaB [Nocardioides faecalis]MBM9459744.1 tRNA (adenosine(37)-N6)-threonylcarbamoyltransferase complex dimerization subunit type 1 TsaB [Nocardioides faecalis]MBS4753479.1 tRNA (adenosine(37)-N6)-threonylcarbamoyltransferase complex dimerization subunit type 1 TsaB [Nocardioides faecalis]QVI58260.1 tRNA (adenosine(37)-N6)-threonylcarbamoyltransferase complex dimerization subunit type 1 TsaB [Nocardioides f
MLLAFDTASPTVTVALHDGSDVVASATSEVAMKHGEQLAPLIQQVLETAGVAPSAVRRIAVGTGPGPFTGLRVGLVTARTLGHVLDAEVLGVCSLDVLAAEAVATGTVEGAFVVASDARRKEVYLASYDAAGRRTTFPVVDRPATLTTDLPVVGEGAVLYPEAFADARGPRRPDAAWLARAVVAGTVELMAPEPLYLRRPDAEIPRAPKAVLPEGEPAR